MADNVARYPVTFFDLYTVLLQSAREDRSHVETTDQAKRMINEALFDMHLGTSENFWWAERDAVLVTQAPYSTGTVTIAQGGTLMTTAGSAWATNNAFGQQNVNDTGRIVVAGGHEKYRFVPGTPAAGGATLSSRFTQESVTAGTYQVFYEDYNLASDFLRPVDLQLFSSERDIQLVGIRDFRRKFEARTLVTGRPRHGTMVNSPVAASTDNDNAQFLTRRIRLYPAPDQAYSIPYAYITNELGVSGGASGAFVFRSNPSDGHTIGLNGTTFTFRSSPSLATEIQIGATSHATILNAATTLNASTDAQAQQCTYSRQGDELLVVYDAPSLNTNGFNFQLTESSTAITISASTTGFLVDRRPQVQLIGDLDEPIVPLEYRMAIVHYARHRWYRDKKDDDRAGSALEDYDRTLARTLADHEQGQQRPSLRPQVSRYKQAARKPWRRGGGRYDLNGRFDRLEDRF